MEPTICIDAVPLLVPSAGIKNYLHYWIGALRSANRGELQLFPWLTRSRLGLRHDGSCAPRFDTRRALAFYYALQIAGLDRWKPRCDVFHASKLHSPPRGARLSATIHDLTCWLMPEFHTAANVNAEQEFAQRVWKRADGLIAVSESTRADAVRLLGIDPRKITVIPNGVASPYFAADAREAAAAAAVLRLNRPYILFVGSIEPRKNLDTALDAYAALTRSVREEFDFLIAGPLGWAAPATASRIQSAGPGVRRLGYVPEVLLPGLTAGATAFFYVSLYEGFGFPVAQAMAAAVPVVTSAVSSLPEITGEAAVLVDPRSVAEIRTGLEQVLLSPTLRERLSRAGRQRAERYRWERCAEASWDFFRELAG